MNRLSGTQEKITINKDPEIKRTQSNLKDLKEKLGAKEFKKLKAKVEPKAEEIVRKMLDRNKSG